MVNKLEQFINDSVQKHGNFYIYNKVVFVKMSDSVTITCPIHGDFTQTPTQHKFGYGCPSCGRERTKHGQQQHRIETTLTTYDFVKRANLIHGNKYDYSAVVYVNWKTKVNIICKTHGVFKQSPGKHIDSTRSTGCPKCANKYQTTEDFITKATKKHGSLYDYTQTSYVNDTTKVIITCKQHGPFEMLPSNHHSLGQGCSTCAHIQSQNNIGYYAEHLFSTQPHKKSEPVKLYYVKMFNDNEIFYKVGITKRLQVKQRFYGNPYTVEVIAVEEGLLYDMWLKEQTILQQVHRYAPQHKFNGWTECFASPL